MGLLDRQRQSVIDASTARTSARADRFLRDDRARFRTAEETKDRSFQFRPEYGWAMNDEGLLAEQERKSAYDKAVSDYSGQVDTARADLNNSVVSGRESVGSAYGDASAETSSKYGEAQSDINSAFSGAIGQAGSSSPEMSSYTVRGDTYSVANLDQFKQGIRETPDSYSYSEGEGGERMTAGSYDSNWASQYIQSQNSQIQQARDANISALRAQQSASNASLAKQKSTAASNLAKERNTALSNYDSQAASKVASYETLWTNNLNHLKGLYDTSVKDGAAKYEDMKARYNNSITGADEGLLGGATTGISDEHMEQWGFNEAEISTEELISMLDTAKKEENTGLAGYITQIVESRTEPEEQKNAEETVQPQ